MKKLIASLSLVLVVALGVVGFSACKKTSVVGKWDVVLCQQYIDGKCIDEMDYDTILERNGRIVFVLKKNGTGTCTSGDYVDNITWKKTKNGCVVSCNDNEWNGEIKKGKLVLTYTISYDNKEDKCVYICKKIK